MNITVTSRHLGAGQSLHKHVRNVPEESVGKFFDHAMDAHMTFDRNGHAFSVDIKVQAGRGLHVRGEGQANDPHVAFNTASEHVAKRPRRHKRRLKDHRSSPPTDLATPSAPHYILMNEEESGSCQPDANAAHDGRKKPVAVAEMTTKNSLADSR